jgi:hypothetical protein
MLSGGNNVAANAEQVLFLRGRAIDAKLQA